MKLDFRIRDFWTVALLMLFGVFLSTLFFWKPNTAYAEDELIERSADSSEHFVTIHDNGTSRVVKTGTVTVGEVLERSEVTLAETDLVEPSLDTLVTADYNINVYRARPAIVIDGIHRRYTMTASHDPKQIAIEAGFTVYDGDIITAEFNTNFLETGAASVYQIERNGGRTLTVEESIPYPTETRYDYNRPRGERLLERAGEDGRRTSVYEVKFEHNEEVSRELISEEVVVEPLPEIVIIGAKVSVPPEREACANWAREAGVSEEDLGVAVDLIYRESGCRVDARNTSSGAYGIPQALPGNKMISAGNDWETNPVTQIRWMIGYVNERYGGWRQALDFWWCTGQCSNRYGTIQKKGTWY